jgi:hypothetical protein
MKSRVKKKRIEKRVALFERIVTQVCALLDSISLFLFIVYLLLNR